MPIGNEELVIRGEDGKAYVVTSTGDLTEFPTAEPIAYSIHTTTSDSGKTSAGDIWFRTDV